MFDFTADLEQLASRTREFEHNGLKFVLEVRDPYGFWVVDVLGSKKKPPELSGQFTNLTDAQNCARLYADKQVIRTPVNEVQEEPVAPIVRKKVATKTK